MISAKRCKPRDQNLRRYDIGGFMGGKNLLARPNQPESLNCKPSSKDHCSSGEDTYLEFSLFSRTYIPVAAEILKVSIFVIARKNSIFDRVEERKRKSKLVLLPCSSNCSSFRSIFFLFLFFLFLFLLRLLCTSS